MSYSSERKNAVLAKLLPPYNRSVPDVAKEEGISEGTLYNWRSEVRKSGKPVPNNEENSYHWSAEAKFAVVLETSSMNESELSQYCREKGLYPEQVVSWREASMNGVANEAIDSKAHKTEVKRRDKKIKKLEKELRYKDKALAETTALLVMQKKLHALWGIEDEES
jgi:transposase-like protein